MTVKFYIETNKEKRLKMIFFRKLQVIGSKREFIVKFELIEALAYEIKLFARKLIISTPLGAYFSIFKI